MVRTVTSLILFSMILLLPLSAGGQKEEEIVPEPQTKEFSWQAFAGTKLNLMFNKHPWTDLINEHIREFEALTGIKAELSVYPESQFRTKRTVELASGVSDMDAFMMQPGGYLAKYTQGGWLLPLNELMNSQILLWPEYALDDIFPAALKAGEKNGTNYTIPILSGTNILTYNTEVFSKFGVSEPATMDEIETVAKKIYESSGNEIYGITLRGKKAAATSKWVDFLHSFGGEWLLDDGTSGVATPAAIAATDFYGRLVRLYGPKSAPNNSWYENISIFMQGKAGMVYESNVFKANYDDPEESLVTGKVGYMVIPKGPAGSVPQINQWAMAIYSQSKKKEAAWLFIQWATSKEMQLREILAGIPASRNSAWENPEFKRMDDAPDWTNATIESFKIANPHWNPPVVAASECRDAVGSAIVASILGEDVKAACEKAAAEMDKVIRETE